MTHSSSERLLFISSSSSYFLHHHLELAMAATSRYAVHLAVNLDSCDDLDRLQKHGITVHPMEISRSSINVLAIAGEIRKLRSIIRQVRPKVINPVSLKCVFIAAFAAGGHPGCGFVGTVVGLGYMFSGNSLKQRVLRRLTLQGLAWIMPRLRHRLIFSNPDDREVFLAHGIGTPDIASVIPVPGINVADYGHRPEEDHGFKVVMPARMVREKGVREFVEAAEIIKNRNARVEFYLAGGCDPNNPSAISEHELGQWSSRGVVSWLGHVDDLPEFLASCHVVCLPSYYREGFPRVLAEAMACGRSIVTTDMPGCRDAGEKYDCALLVSPGSGRKLAEAILSLHESPETRRRLGDNGRKAAHRYLHQPMITNEVLKVFQSFS